MKLKINNKLQEVGFWSFLKCQILVSLALAGMEIAAILALALLGFIWISSLI